MCKACFIWQRGKRGADKAKKRIEKPVVMLPLRRTEHAKVTNTKYCKLSVYKSQTILRSQFIDTRICVHRKPSVPAYIVILNQGTFYISMQVNIIRKIREIWKK